MNRDVKISWSRGLFRGSGVRFSCQAGVRANIRLMFQARVTSVHSPLTLARPRRENRRKPITALMMPNTGSGVYLRRA